METVKVDMHKLQLLNDRIAQTLEALNQVRLSVHGIQHTPSPTWNTPGYGQSIYGSFSPYGSYSQVPFAQPTFAQPTFSPPYMSPYNTPFVPGLQHTTHPTWTTIPYSTNGLSHTTWDPRLTQPWPVYPVTTY